ncbi:glutathione S-transferase N-terminal domain-containing protein [Methylobacterium sp. 17Sr1-1]|uniref:glutathione S-transferase family protein n=1 Tax=Methylobacterium sp. 17Sr1-1 TaxID=2202826 RepID=UPI000D6EC10A|nr:glutathione S-transferase N-terminal domain-containing protein [Methylobacterium sp. 17Sr1-1]AWN52519.1 glutathione S-transferase [Methylobacterium sp. 17Sr1-1]
MLSIWGRRTSSNVQALMWCVGELGLPHERHDAGHRYGGTDTPAFRAMNPNGTIPVLRDGDGEPLWETSAILRYLAGRYGPDAFWPAESAARARVDKWAEWAKLNVAMNFTAPIFWRVVRTAPADQDPVALSRALATLGRFLDIAEARLCGSAFLASDALTLADIQFGHVLFRYFDVAIPREDRPALRRYYDGLLERPAFREHIVVSYEELRPDGQQERP